MKIETDLVPLRRPHFQLRGSHLFFMISRRPYMDLGPEEVELWKRIDGLTPVADLQSSFANAHEVLGRFLEHSVIEMAPASFAPERKRVLVIEPHMDDAVLSVGGLMLERRNSHEFIVATVASYSNFTSYYQMNREYFDVESVTALRCLESELVMRVLGGKHVAVGGNDAPLRYQGGNWSLDWFLKNKRSISAFINHSPTSEEVHSLAGEIGKILAATDASEIWIPMGVGTSADHEMTRNACLLALINARELFGRVELYFYQDVPYAMNFPRHSEQILEALAAAGASIERIPVNITGSMPEKLRLISVYASQFKMNYMGPRVEATGRMAIGNDHQFGELLVRVRRLPHSLDYFELYSGRDQVRDLARSMRGWLMRNRKKRKITVLCPMGVGRWEEFMKSILSRFPDANVEFHLTEDGVEETLRFVSPRIRIIPVRARGLAWVLRIIRVMLTGSRPLIVFTGLKFSRIAGFVRFGCFFSDPVTAVSIGHFVQALAHEEWEDGRRLPADHDLR